VNPTWTLAARVAFFSQWTCSLLTARALPTSFKISHLKTTWASQTLLLTQSLWTQISLTFSYKTATKTRVAIIQTSRSEKTSTLLLPSRTIAPLFSAPTRASWAWIEAVILQFCQHRFIVNQSAAGSLWNPASKASEQKMKEFASDTCKKRWAQEWCRWSSSNKESAKGQEVSLILCQWEDLKGQHSMCIGHQQLILQLIMHMVEPQLH